MNELTYPGIKSSFKAPGLLVKKRLFLPTGQLCLYQLEGLKWLRF
jgi:hypothetical protein